MFLRKSLFLGGVCAAIMAASAAMAEAKNIDIPAGDLKVALDAYIQQTGAQLIFRIDDVKGTRTAGVHGVLSSDEALKRLVARTGLAVHRDQSGAFLLAQADSAPVPAPSPAQAEAPATAPIDMGFEDVVVTARRVEEGLQQVPIAITALSGEELERKRVTSALDLNQAVPGVHVAPFQNADQLILAIRGQRSSQNQPGQDQAIGLYLNEVPAVYPYGLNIGLFDLADIQVLKGPQGTLFGRNTTGGAILINTKKPTDKYEGYIRAGYEGFYIGNGFTTTTVLNVPILDNLNIRFALDTVNRDGYLENLAPRSVVAGLNIGPSSGFAWPWEKTDFQPLGELNSQVWRLGVDWSPTSRINNYFMYQGTNMRGTDTPPHLFGIYTNNPAPPPLSAGSFALGINNGLPYVGITRDADNFWSTMAGVELPFRLDVHQFIDTFTWNLGDNLTFKNIASYKLMHRMAARELLGLPQYVSNIPFLVTDREFSEEAQLQGVSFGDRLSWVAGVFFMQASLNFESSGMYFGYNSRQTHAFSQTLAGYAQGTYQLPFLEGLSATLGVRYTADDRSVQVSAYRLSPTACSLRDGTAVLAPCVLEGKKKFGQWTYNATLTYQFDPETMIYATNSRGYRSGGLNSADSNLNSFPLGYKPETNKNYEIGLKRDWDFGFPLRTNVAGYIQKYTNVVRQLYPLNVVGNITQLLINGPAADILGGEVEIRAIPIEGLELDISYAYMNAHYTKDWQPIAGLQGRPLRFALVPANQILLSATYTLPFIDSSHGEISITGSFTHQSRMWGDDTQQPPYYPAVGTKDDLAQKPYSLIDLRVDWKSIEGSNFDLDIWVKNLANKKYYTAFNPSSNSGFLSGYVGMPRMVGFDVKYRFGG